MNGTLMIKQWKSLARFCGDIDLERWPYLVGMKLQILLTAQSLPQAIESKSLPGRGPPWQYLVCLDRDEADC